MSQLQTVPGRRSSPAGTLARAVRNLHPGAFAFVMATGIISTGFSLLHRSAVSVAVLWVGELGAALLLVGYVCRLVAFPRAVLGDMADPQRAFGFLTIVAGLNVLAARVSSDGHATVVETLIATAAVVWLVLAYAIPARLMLGEHPESVASAANGSWFLWVVSTQSVAIGAVLLSALHPAVRADWLDVAVGLWAVGTVLYLMLLTVVTMRLLASPVTAHGLSPTYWIYMGATAITTLAGARIVGAAGGAHVAGAAQASPILVAAVPVVTGLTFMLWAFGTWWIPLLVVFGVWRHVVRRESPAYETTWWSIVFPLGMYSVASIAFGLAAHLGFMVHIGRAGIWVAGAAWLVTAVAMLSRIRLHPEREPTSPAADRSAP